MALFLNKLGKLIFQRARSKIVQLSNHNLGAASALFHTSTPDFAFRNGPKKFLQHNKTKFEPQNSDEEPRQAVSNC